MSWSDGYGGGNQMHIGGGDQADLARQSRGEAFQADPSQSTMHAGGGGSWNEMGQQWGGGRRQGGYGQGGMFGGGGFYNPMQYAQLYGGGQGGYGQGGGYGGQGGYGGVTGMYNPQNPGQGNPVGPQGGYGQAPMGDPLAITQDPSGGRGFVPPQAGAGDPSQIAYDPSGGRGFVPPHGGGYGRSPSGGYSSAPAGGMRPGPMYPPPPSGLADNELARYQQITARAQQLRAAHEGGVSAQDQQELQGYMSRGQPQGWNPYSLTGALGQAASAPQVTNAQLGLSDDEAGQLQNWFANPNQAPVGWYESKSPSQRQYLQGLNQYWGGDPSTFDNRYANSRTRQGGWNQAV